MSQSPLQYRVEALKFEMRFQTQQQHQDWLQTPEALAEILKDPGKAIWPVDYRNWIKK